MTTEKTETNAVDLPVGSIDIMENFNARTHFDAEAMESLSRSIASQGVVQPIVVRVTDDEGRFELVAGERRLRACRDLKLATIPAIIRVLTDEQAIALMDAENSERENLSAAEEARLARRAVSDLDGDRDAAAALLGWAKSKIDRRLLLLNAAEPVLDALMRKEIKIGHAELLSTRPEAQQIATLPAIIENGFSVAQLKDKLSDRVLDLAEAIFDTAGCQGCQHNSNTQAGLFGSVLGESKCGNSTCYEDKRLAEVARRKADAADEYNALHTDVERDPDSYITLEQLGEAGVGPSQFKACKGCGDYGGLMSTRPGQEGEVIGGLCFNKACNTDKVAEYAKSKSQESDGTKATPEKTKGAPAGGKAKAKKAKSAPKVSKPAASKKAIEKHDAAIRAGGAEALQTDFKPVLALAVWAMSRQASNALAKLESTPILKALGSAYEANVALPTLLAATEAELKDALTALATGYLVVDGESASNLNGGSAITKAGAMLVNYGSVDMAGRVAIDKDYLTSETKATLGAICEQSGWAAHVAGKNEDSTVEGVMKTTLGAKKEAVIETILAEGFDWSGYIPEQLAKTLSDNPATAKEHKDGK